MGVWMRLRSRTTTVYVPVFIDVTVLPAVVLSVIVKPGPDVRTSFVFGVTAPLREGGFCGGGCLGRDVPDGERPFIVPWCAIALVRVRPVTEGDRPVHRARVADLRRLVDTRRPKRWNLCSSARSSTSIS